MLVDDKQAREKMAKIAEEKCPWRSPVPAIIRQTDLSDCKVEVADLEQERERIANDLCQWCEGYTVKEIFSEALQEYANLCLRENLIRSVEIAAEKDERIESLSAQVAELKKDAERMAKALRELARMTRYAMPHLCEICDFALAAKESGVSP